MNKSRGAACGLTAWLILTATTNAQLRPNIVFVLADDMGDHRPHRTRVMKTEKLIEAAR